MNAGIRSAASFLSALAAATLFWQSRTHPKYLVVAALLLLTHLWVSQRGAVLQDLANRLADVLVIGGIAESGWCNTILAYWAAIAALLVAYVGLSGQAAGVQREYSGVMSKPWRMVLLSIGAVATCILVHRGEPFYWGGWSAIDWMHWLILAGSGQTIVVRLSRIFGALDAK